LEVCPRLEARGSSNTGLGPVSPPRRRREAAGPSCREGSPAPISPLLQQTRDGGLRPCAGSSQPPQPSQARGLRPFEPPHRPQARMPLKLLFHRAPYNTTPAQVEPRGDVEAGTSRPGQRAPPGWGVRTRQNPPGESRALRSGAGRVLGWPTLQLCSRSSLNMGL